MIKKKNIYHFTDRKHPRNNPAYLDRIHSIISIREYYTKIYS